MNRRLRPGHEPMICSLCCKQISSPERAFNSWPLFFGSVKTEEADRMEVVDFQDSPTEPTGWLYRQLAPAVCSECNEAVVQPTRAAIAKRLNEAEQKGGRR